MREAHRRRRTLDRKPHSTEIVCIVPSKPTVVHGLRCAFDEVTIFVCVNMEDEVYEYPDVWVCLFDTYGCDEQGLEEECANSSSLIEGLAPTAVFYPNDDDPTDYRRQEIAGNSALTDVSTIGWCVVFNTSEVTTFLGEERDPDLYLDYFRLDMYWYPGGEANASNTCVRAGERWTPHKEWVYIYLHDPAKSSTSTGMQISYSCINSATDSHIFTTMGIGLTDERNLRTTDERSYKALSTSPSIFKDAVNETIFTPYAYLAMEIQQEPDSLQVITEIDPLEWAEILGNVGGFWDLILILWPIFFVSATRESPTLKPRNLRKSVVRAAERAKNVTPTVVLPRPLRRTMSVNGGSRSIQTSDQPVEVPYWENPPPSDKLSDSTKGV
eukprot:jgi/Undpi1/4461/HiC_scaffold_17.g07815.m1